MCIVLQVPSVYLALSCYCLLLTLFLKLVDMTFVISELLFTLDYRSAGHAVTAHVRNSVAGCRGPTRANILNT